MPATIQANSGERDTEIHPARRCHGDTSAAQRRVEDEVAKRIRFITSAGFSAYICADANHSGFTTWSGCTLDVDDFWPKQPKRPHRSRTPTRSWRAACPRCLTPRAGAPHLVHDASSASWWSPQGDACHCTIMTRIIAFPRSTRPTGTHFLRETSPQARVLLMHLVDSSHRGPLLLVGHRSRRVVLPGSTGRSARGGFHRGGIRRACRRHR